jgi:hypothetical protein
VSGTRIFVSYDVAHDRDLYERLVSESETVSLGITLSACSAPFVKSDAETDDWSERARRGIRGAERVLVICGEHTDASMGVAAELRIAREERKPYLLLWGRRDLMCKKPDGAKPSEGMYMWTSSTFQEQFALMSRIAQREAAANAMKRGASPQAGAHRPAS